MTIPFFNDNILPLYQNISERNFLVIKINFCFLNE